MHDSIEILAISITTTSCYAFDIVTGRSGSLPLLTIKRRQGTTTAAIDGDLLPTDPGHAGFHVLVLVEIFFHLVLVQIRLQAEYFLGNLLVLALDPLQLCLALVEVQTLCFEFNRCD